MRGRAHPRGEAAATHPACARLPRPQQLAALGTVLCLYKPQSGGELGGWSQAWYAESRVGLCSDGLRESLLFFDRRGQCCWRICLLPDSDFLAWDQLLAWLPPPTRDAAESGGLSERLWRRLSAGLLGGGWRMCALRLHVLAQPDGLPLLAASPSTVSELGVAEARRIARAEGVEGVEGEVVSAVHPRSPGDSLADARAPAGCQRRDSASGKRVLPYSLAG